MKNNSVNKLLRAFGEKINLKASCAFKDKIYHSLGCFHSKKWIANILPSELLSCSLKEAIELILTLCENNVFYDIFPNVINTPNYGDNWGRFANYIEINNRAIADMDKNRTCCGILDCIKLLPAIPPSAKSWANCIIISQIFPNIYGDTYNSGAFEENSIYGIKLNANYSGNVVSYDILDKITPEEQLKAFCDLAHFRGIKVGFRTVISADQIKVCYPNNEEENFRWDNPNHVELYINESVKLMDIGFSFISEVSMTAKSIKLAIDCYDNGVDFKEARNKIVEFNRELGMFQAPANVAFVVLGLLYGEGDFKKSILLATSCGDDTDCTAATVGSTMALMGGMKAIPEDWAEYVGDKILSYAIDLSMKRLCRSCSELTKRIVKQLPGVLSNFDVQVEFTDGETEYTEEKPFAIIPQFSIPTNPYTYDDLADLTHTKLRAEFDRAPIVKPGETIKLTVTFLNGMYDPRNLFLKLHRPEGWSAEYKKHIAIMHDSTGHRWIDEQPWDAVITVGENTETINKLFLEVSAEGNPRTGMVPIVILG